MELGVQVSPHSREGQWGLWEGWALPAPAQGTSPTLQHGGHGYHPPSQ